LGDRENAGSPGRFCTPIFGRRHLKKRLAHDRLFAELMHFSKGGRSCLKKP
jgi:hypothetical protein